MSASAFTPTVLTISSGTGSGSGEKNYITNPSMASATTGWNVVGDFTLTRTTAASELPREYTTGTGIKLVATSGTQSTADYMYFDFNLDDVDLGKKLKIQWSQKKIGTYSAGQLAVVITSQADRTTALITPQTTAIPASDFDFVTSFDSTTTAALSLVIRATADMTTGDGIVLSDVIVGPGEIVPGAAISEWQTFTVVANNISSSGTNALSYGRYRRIGSAMELNIVYRCGSTGGSSSSNQVSFNVPDNWLIDTNIAQGVGGGAIPIGVATWYDSSAAIFKTIFATWGSSSTIVFNVSGTGGSLLGTDIGANQDDRIAFTILIPISQWSGSGTVNLGPAAQVEYAATSGTWNADDSTTVYGPGGAALGGTLTAQRTKTITFQYPIQADDLVSLEFSTDAQKWLPQASATLNSGSIPCLVGMTGLGPGTMGANCIITGSNTVQVRFGQYQIARFDDGSNAGNWPSSSAYWRVRKAKASSPVGFGLAGTDGSAGLYKPGAVPGYVAGVTIPASYVGQKLELQVTSNQALTNTNTLYNVFASSSTTGLILTPGVWLVYGAVVFGQTALGTGTVVAVTSAISTSNTSIDTDAEGFARQAAKDSITAAGLFVPTGHRYFNISVNTTIYLLGMITSTANTTSGAVATTQTKLNAIRIA